MDLLYDLKEKSEPPVQNCCTLRVTQGCLQCRNFPAIFPQFFAIGFDPPHPDRNPPPPPLHDYFLIGQNFLFFTPFTAKKNYTNSPQNTIIQLNDFLHELYFSQKSRICTNGFGRPQQTQMVASGSGIVDLTSDQPAPKGALKHPALNACHQDRRLRDTLASQGRSSGGGQSGGRGDIWRQGEWGQQQQRQRSREQKC